MKNLHIIFIYMLTLLLSAVANQPLQAQKKAVQDALYIYRNDGGFNAFFYSDIDRFEYSRIDTLGVEHEDYVVQEVYANDSIYRIPLSAIDSISFVTPETVYKNDVAHTSESDLWNYVVSSDSTSTFVLAANIPQTLIPKKGDKLVTINQSSALPAGFIGQVASVSHDAAGITVACDLIDLSDVFVQYVAKARTADENEAAARRVPARASSETPTITTKDYPIDMTFDLISPGVVAQYGQILASGKVAKVKVHGVIKEWWRIFRCVNRDGTFNDWQNRVETDIYITPTINAALTQRIDLPLGKIFPIPVPSLPGAWVSTTGGVTISLSGSLNTVLTYHGNAVCVENVQQNRIRGIIEGYKNQHNGIHLQKYTCSISLDKVSGSVSGTLGFYSSACLSLGLPDVGPKLMVNRVESGIRPTLSAEFKEDDFAKLLPSMLGMGTDDTYSTSYHLLNREGSISLQPYISAKILIGLGLGPAGIWETFENSFDLDKLRSYFPSAFKNRWWAVEGQLAPTFSMPSLEFKGGSAAPTAIVGIGGRTVFDTPVGIAAYYSKSGKQLGKTLWYGQTYNSWYNWVEDYANNDNITEYSLQMPKFGGGKEVYVYPTYKLFDYEMLGNPVAKATVPAKLESDPPQLTFDAKGGKENLTVTDNLDRSEDTYKDELDVTYEEKEKEEWLTVKKTNGAYEVTAKPNTTAEERTASINFSTYNEDRSIDLTLTVPVMQKMPEYEFSVDQENLPLPGYSKDFKDGELTQTVTVKYPVTAKSIKLKSSESWLRIDNDWTTNTADDFNYTATRKIYIKANTDLVNPREAKVIAELTKADGTTEIKTCVVMQEQMKLEVKLEPDKITLMAVGTNDGKYSDTQTVTVKITPYDDIVASVIKDQYVEPEAEWIKATLADRVITVRGDANPVYEERKNYVTYVLVPTTGAPITCTLEVNQEALQENIVCDDYTPKSIVFPAEGGEIDVTFNCDNIDHIKELTTFITGWLEGGKIGSKSIRLFAPNPNTGERKSGRFFIVFVMKDGTEQKQYYTAYQEGKMNIKKIYFKTFNKVHSEIVRYNEDEQDNFWNWLLMDATAESHEMDLLVTKDNFTINSSIDGNTLHVDCVGSGQSFGMTQKASLSFDVVNYNATKPDKAMVTNVKMVNDVTINAGGDTGSMNMAVNVDNIPVWNLSPLYIASVGTVANGVKFSNFYDVISIPDGKATGYYENDDENYALLRISFEGNDDDDWRDVIEEDDWGDDDDWSRSTARKAMRPKVSSTLERRMLEQLRKIGEQ